MALVKDVVIVGHSCVDPRKNGQSKEGQSEEETSHPAGNGAQELEIQSRHGFEDNEKCTKSLKYQETRVHLEYVHLFCCEHREILGLPDD